MSHGSTSKRSGFRSFNQKVSTSKHFGYLRASLPDLVQPERHEGPLRLHRRSVTQISYWRENKLFIFDDTLLHELVERNQPSTLLPVRRHRSPDAVPQAFMRAVMSGVRAADAELQVRVLSATGRSLTGSQT